MVVSRRGASARAPRTKFESPFRAPHHRRRLRRRNVETAGRFRRSGVRGPALQSAAQGRSQAPRRIPRRCRQQRLGQVLFLRRLRRFHPRLAAGLPPRHEAVGDVVGDRLLPQHLPRRLDHAGPRLLGAQRHRLAQDQSDAEFPRPPLHQCARDHDLGRARREGQGLYLQLRSPEGRQRGRAGAFRLADPALHRRGAVEGQRRQESPSDPEAGGPAGARAAVVVETRRSRDRPLQRHRHHRRRRQNASAAATSASSATKPTPKPPQRASPRSSRCRKPHWPRS